MLDTFNFEALGVIFSAICPIEMKNLLNHVWRIVGYAICSIVSGYTGIAGFTLFVIPAYHRPIDSEGLAWLLLKYPALLFFSVLGVGFILLSIVCFIGIFKPSWDESYKQKKKKISPVCKYQNFGGKMIYESKDDNYDNSRSYFCFFELDNSDQFVAISTNTFHKNKFNDEIVDKSEIVVQSTNNIPWGCGYMGFKNWFELHFKEEWLPISPPPITILDRHEGQEKVIVDFYKEYIKNDEDDKTEIVYVSE